MRQLIDEPEIEYVGGRAYAKVSRKRTHAIVQANLVAIFQRCAGDAGVAGTEWRFHVAPGTSLVPDVAYVSYERLRALSDEQAEEPPFAPDVVAEVRSPSHRAALLQEKIASYLQQGALLVLDVDPQARRVFAHDAGGGIAEFREGDAFACDAVPWLRFAVSEAFARVTIPR